MSRRHVAATVLAVVAATGVAGCGNGTSSDGEMKAVLLRGVAEIRGSHYDDRLRAKLARTLAQLRSVSATTPEARTARRLAIAGFASTISGIESRLAISRNDSGELAAAARDTIRAERSLKLGADRLRAAGRALGLHVGSLNGY
jgi:hypothetical protein